MSQSTSWFGEMMRDQSGKWSLTRTLTLWLNIIISVAWLLVSWKKGELSDIPQGVLWLLGIANGMTLGHTAIYSGAEAYENRPPPAIIVPPISTTPIEVKGTVIIPTPTS